MFSAVIGVAKNDCCLCLCMHLNQITTMWCMFHPLNNGEFIHSDAVQLLFSAISALLSKLTTMWCMFLFLIHFCCRWQQNSKIRRIIQWTSRDSTWSCCRLFESLWFCFYAKFAQCMSLYHHNKFAVRADFPSEFYSLLKRALAGILIYCYSFTWFCQLHAMLVL